MSHVRRTVSSLRGGAENDRYWCEDAEDARAASLFDAVRDLKRQADAFENRTGATPPAPRPLWGQFRGQ